MMDPILNALVQTGGLGILAAVLLWLHVRQQTANDKLQEQYQTASEQQTNRYTASVTEITSKHAAIMTEAIRTFREELRYEREQCQEQFNVLMEQMTNLRR